jgi:hypothetical protein
LQFPIRLQIVQIDPFSHQPQGCLRTQIAQKNISAEMDLRQFSGGEKKYVDGMLEKLRLPGCLRTDFPLGDYQREFLVPGIPEQASLYRYLPLRPSSLAGVAAAYDEDAALDCGGF